MNGFLIAGHNGGTHSKPDECHQNDLQYFSVLQHLRENDLALCQGHQSDDHHLQGLHYAWCEQNLGNSTVGLTIDSKYKITCKCRKNYGDISYSNWFVKQ